MKYKYKIFYPQKLNSTPEDLGVLMKQTEIEDWLNRMGKDGWEFVSYAMNIIELTRYKDIRQMWIFKKLT